MQSEITVSELAKQTGLSVSHIVKLIQRGILPAGRKDGKSRYLPTVETKLIISSHESGQDWKERRKRANSTKALAWADLI